MTKTRITSMFERVQAEERPAFITFMTAGDPDYESALALLKMAAQSGSDLLEIGMPFSDPMADGPAIQRANIRALNAGQTLKRTLEMVRDIRQNNDETPIVLMGYYNPVWSYGCDKFLQEAKTAGVDGLIIVDLPAEMDDELCKPALAAGINFIRLATPTTDDNRLPIILQNSSGFVYYVSITGITGMAAPNAEQVAQAVKRIKNHTNLPVAVGFGVRTPEQAAVIGKNADGVVVGSAIVEAIEANLDDRGHPASDMLEKVQKIILDLSTGIAQARK